jgi:hypothetical protein
MHHGVKNDLACSNDRTSPVQCCSCYNDQQIGGMAMGAMAHAILPATQPSAVTELDGRRVIPNRRARMQSAAKTICDS